jgi:hypothetical protein
MIKLTHFAEDVEDSLSIDSIKLAEHVDSQEQELEDVNNI